MQKFFLSVSPTVWVICATILAATALACLTFKDYDRYAIYRYGTNNSWIGVIDKKTGVLFYSPSEGVMKYRDYPNGTIIRRKQKELEK